MINKLDRTPNASRLHIAIFGRRNSGKSSLINAISNQNTALVSKVAGTTTDPVYKPIELYPVGPCVLIDTAGFDDEGDLGQLRVQKTTEVLCKTDLAVLVITSEQSDFSFEKKWLKELNILKKPVLVAINKADLLQKIPDFAAELPHVLISAKQNTGIDLLKSEIARLSPVDFELPSITAHLAGPGDHVLLVAPQDIQAPKGRLILPQVQTIRDLLDLKSIVTIVTTDQLEETLALLKEPPKLIITDSQVFRYVYDRCPKQTKLTSFSVLMARYKGDLDEYIQGAQAVDSLKETDKVLILEACTHNPLDGDIGRVKIPNMLRKKIGETLTVDMCSGNQIPEDLTPYALVIHCGGCMFNRTHVLSRIARCIAQNVPITNYGIFIAKVSGILDKIDL